MEASASAASMAQLKIIKHPISQAVILLFIFYLIVENWSIQILHNIKFRPQKYKK